MRSCRPAVLAAAAVLAAVCVAAALLVAGDRNGVPFGAGGSTPGASGTGTSEMVVGTTKPTAANVGAGKIRAMPTQPASDADGTWNDGVLTITKDLRDRVVHGLVKVGASGLRIENCDIRGDVRHAPSGGRYMIDTGGGFTRTLVRYNTIHSTYPSRFLNAIGPRNVIAEFNDISHVTDGFVPSPGGGSSDVEMLVRANYVHDLQFFAPDPGHAPTPLTTAGGVPITGPWAGLPWNHADAIQVQVDGTTGLEVYGNNLVATWARDPVSTLPLPNAIAEMSALMLNAGTDLTIEDNWIDGGEYAVNNADPSVTGTMARNRFGRQMARRGPGDGGYLALMLAADGLRTHDGTADQNVWQDSGRLVPRRQN